MGKLTLKQSKAMGRWKGGKKAKWYDNWERKCRIKELELGRGG